MTTGLVYDVRFLEHETGVGHPERPARLRAIVDRLKRAHLWEELHHIPFGPANLKWVQRVHEPAYLRRLQAACAMGESYIDVQDSSICPASYETAMLAVGGALAAGDAVMSGQVHNAFCALRPPGHHAEVDRSMGFCLLNNVAILAEYLLARYGLKRVAIVDFDVHHGNGTQHIFEDRSDVLYISLHEHPSYLYPGTGFAWETGEGAGKDCTLNIPLDPGADDQEYRRQMVFRVMPVLEKFQPQALLLSAGFDAAKEDPLAHMVLTPQGFEWMTQHLKATAERLCEGRIISLLEGGYDLRSLAECVLLHTAVLLQPSGQDPIMAMKAGMG